jgi:hypothetical protein
VRRKVIGDPKAGLTLRIVQTPTTMSLEALPDPLMLYIVIAAAIIAGIVGAVASSPKAGVVSFLTLVLIFSPLLCVLAFNAIRVRSRCFLDRERDVLRIDERSYTRRFQAEHHLEEVEGVAVRKMPSGPLSGGPWSFGLFLVLRDADYMAAWGNNEATIVQDAWRISRFLDLPLETPEEQAPDGEPRRRGVVMTTAMLYLLPIVLAISALVFVSQEMPGVVPTLAGFLGAIVISQIGAILAVAYYRMRRPYET